MNVTKLATIKNLTNGNDPCKQYFLLLNQDKKNAVLIKKLVLIDISDVNDWLRTGHECIKTFKSKALMYNHFSMKVSTFKTISNLLP